VALSVVEYSAPEKREQNKESSFSKGNRKECVDLCFEKRFDMYLHRGDSSWILWTGHRQRICSGQCESEC
jgi:hypothetical protein